MIVNNEPEIMLPFFNVPSKHLPAGTEENGEKCP